MTTTTAPHSATPRILSILWGIFLDAGLALAVYYGLRLAGLAPYWALLGGALVAGLRLGYGLLRARRIEGFAAFMCAGFLIGTALALITGSERFLLLKDSLSTAILGLLFFGSCFVGKPFIFHASKRFRAAGGMEDAEWERKWRDLPGFRAVFRTMTLVWAVAFVVEAIVRVPIVVLLPIDQAAALSGLLMPVMLVGLLSWTLRRGRRSEQRLAAVPGDPQLT
ncbi:intracellular septation protein A [Nocardia transvalensis]|uniref:Intracellular septation protein A n=1 Tax=Nocardia transvalensis TaxID=37333 RepID=A0A7W9PLT8_9NOCA|nr:VC0807 family protein [Nocardia transvalensis]MBB5918295.1 intracellular septation protein A [Nocardia transvalensis]